MAEGASPSTALAVPPVREGIRGEVCLPGSKSITHRGLVLGALSTGTTRLSSTVHPFQMTAGVPWMRSAAWVRP